MQEVDVLYYHSQPESILYSTCNILPFLCAVKCGTCILAHPSSSSCWVPSSSIPHDIYCFQCLFNMEHSALSQEGDENGTVFVAVSTIQLLVSLCNKVHL